MLDPEKIVPVAGLLIFVGAVVLLVWGNQLGAVAFVRGIPYYIAAAVAIGAIVVQWRMQKEPGPLGIWRTMLIALLGVLFVASLAGVVR
jgi:hypothetical protein